jgi:PAS domain S-box-containing protein
MAPSVDSDLLLRFWAQLPDPVVVTSIAGVVLYWHSSAERLYGYRQDEAVGQPLAELLAPPEQADAEHRLLAQAIATGSARGVSVRRLKSGAVIQASIAKRTILRGDGTTDCVLSVEREVPKDLLGQYAHEMRTPLNGILGFAQLLLSEKAGALNEKQRRFATVVLDSGRDLLQRVDEVDPRTQ